LFRASTAGLGNFQFRLLMLNLAVLPVLLVSNGVTDRSSNDRPDGCAFSSITALVSDYSAQCGSG
jgi:hypothetical protein